MSAAPPADAGTIEVLVYMAQPGSAPIENEAYDLTSHGVVPRAATISMVRELVLKMLGNPKTDVSLYAAPAGWVGEAICSRALPMCRFLALWPPRSTEDMLPPGTRLVALVSNHPAGFDIGVFAAAVETVNSVPAGDAPGALYLSSPLIHELDRVAVAAIVADVLHLEGRVGSIDFVASYALNEIVNAEKRAALIAEVTTAYELGDSYPPPTHALTPLEEGVLAGSVRTDFKILLTVERARELLGDAVYNDVVFPLGKKHGPPDALVLRRTEATGRWINFHTDNARRTVQVPLSDDSACEGGRLVFLHTNGEMEFPKRVAGGLVMHDGDIVHGVTALLKGVRYSFYALRAREDDDD